MKTLVATLALIAMMATASAESITTVCSHDRYGGRCTTQFSPDPAPIIYTPEELAEMQAREDAWAAYCKPVKRVGADGLTRAQYAHKDCDIGVYRNEQ